MGRRACQFQTLRIELHQSGFDPTSNMLEPYIMTCIIASFPKFLNFLPIQYCLHPKLNQKYNSSLPIPHTHSGLLVGSVAGIAARKKVSLGIHKAQAIQSLGFLYLHDHPISPYIFLVTNYSIYWQHYCYSRNIVFVLMVRTSF